MEFRPISNPSERHAAFEVRRQVFVVEQACPPEEEYDDIDASAQHFAAVEKGAVIGTARVYEVEGRAKIGRVAVLKPWRGRGAGAGLMQAAHAWAKQKGYTEAVLHAQTPVIPFYERLGYVAEGEVFYEAAIPHRKMRRRL
jgi:predicted GNAT family N-acyltransferase